MTMPEALRPARRVARPLAACAALALAAWPAAGRPAVPLGPVEAVGGVGLPRVLLAPRAGEVAVLQVTFDVGSMDDASSPGLTRFSQYALLEANRQLSFEALAREVWASDGRLEVVTGHRTCAFTLVASRRDFGRLVRQLVPALLAPRLDAAGLPAAAARAVLDVGEDRDLVSALVDLGSEDREWHTHPPHGRRPVLESLELDEVRAHVERFFVPARAQVVVAGAFDRREVLPLLRRFRGGAPARLERLELDHGHVRRGSPRELHLLAFPLRLAGAREAAAARLLAALIEDALWRELREKGFAYSFEVKVIRSPWLDALAVLVPAHASDERDLGATLQAILESIRTGGFTDPQLEQARAAAEVELAAADADPERLASALASGGTAWHGPAVSEALAALDRGGLLAPARGWLERSLYLYMGPRP